MCIKSCCGSSTRLLSSPSSSSSSSTSPKSNDHRQLGVQNKLGALSLPRCFFSIIVGCLLISSSRLPVVTAKVEFERFVSRKIEGMSVGEAALNRMQRSMNLVGTAGMILDWMVDDSYPAPDGQIPRMKKSNELNELRFAPLGTKTFLKAVPEKAGYYLVCHLYGEVSSEGDPLTSLTCAVISRSDDKEKPPQICSFRGPAVLNSMVVKEKVDEDDEMDVTPDSQLDAFLAGDIGNPVQLHLRGLVTDVTEVDSEQFADQRMFLSLTTFLFSESSATLTCRGVRELNSAEIDKLRISFVDETDKHDKENVDVDNAELLKRPENLPKSGYVKGLHEVPTFALMMDHGNFEAFKDKYKQKDLGPMELVGRYVRSKLLEMTVFEDFGRFKAMEKYFKEQFPAVLTDPVQELDNDEKGVCIRIDINRKMKFFRNPFSYYAVSLAVYNEKGKEFQTLPLMRVLHMPMERQLTTALDVLKQFTKDAMDGQPGDADNDDGDGDEDNGSPDDPRKQNRKFHGESSRHVRQRESAVKFRRKRATAAAVKKKMTLLKAKGKHFRKLKISQPSPSSSPSSSSKVRITAAPEISPHQARHLCGPHARRSSPHHRMPNCALRRRRRRRRHRSIS